MVFGLRRSVSLRLGVSLFAALALLTPTALRAQATATAVALGNVNVGSSTTGTVTFTFSGSTTVASIAVVTQGATGLDFNLNSGAPGTCTATTYANTNTCTVGVKFAPTAAGARYGAVNLLDGSGNILSSGVVSGIGVAPLPVFPTGTASVITSSIASPNFLSIDGAGNVYQPSQSNAIYKITSAGVVSTFYTASDAFTGTAVDPAGNVYAGYTGHILKLSNAGTLVATWPVSGTAPIQPQGMAFDSKGNLYVADPTVGRIVVISPAGVGSVLTVGTISPAGFQAYAVAVDSADTVYIPDYANNRIIEVTSMGATSVISISGTAINTPNGIAVDAAGNIYLAEAGSGILLHITPAGVASNVTPTLSPAISYPVGVALDGHGLLYLSDQNQTSVDKINLLSVGYSVTGTTAVGSASAQQTATVENDGNASATFTSIAAVAPGVKGSSTTCSTSTPLASDATCVAAIYFAPTTHGASPQSGTLSLNGSNFTAPVQTITGYITGDPTQLAITGPPTTGVSAGGNAGSVTVTLEDSTGATAANDQTAPVTLTVTYPDSTQAVYGPTNATAGVVTFNTAGHALTEAGTYTYTAASTGLVNAVTTATVVAGAEAKLAVVAATTNPYLGVSDNITVNAVDVYGNLVASSSDTIALTSTDSNATLPASFALSGGTATKPVTFATAGNQTVTATDMTNASVTQTSVAISVQPVPNFIVNSSAGDTSGTCTNQSAAGATPDSKCTVYAAFVAVTALNNTSLTSYVPPITFAPALTASGPLTITMSTAISATGNFSLIGPGAVTNSITLSGGGSVGFLSWNQGTGTVTGLTFTGFSASFGAVLASSGGTLSASNDIFTGNTATGSNGGGAIYVTNSAYLTLTSDTFSSNNAGNNPGGAFVVTSSTLNASRCTFVSNTAYNGGAIYLSGTTNATITGSVFGGQGASGTAGGNTATNAGGAIDASLGSGSYGLKVYDSLFSGNTAGSSASAGVGGAVYTSSGTNYFYDDTFTANTVTGSSSTTGEGGALFQTTATNYFYNVTVAGNTAKFRGGGVYKNSGSLYAYDSIIEGNSTSNSYADVYSTLTATTGSLTSTAPTATSNPLLSPLGNYGGSTLTMVPLPGSPALRLGNAPTTYTGGQTVDQRGFPRIINSTIDAGAVQSNYTLSFVTQPVNTAVNTALLPPPTVQVFESGVAFGGTGGTLKVAASAGTPSVTSVATTASGLVSLAPTFTTPETDDALIVSVTNGSTTTVVSETSGLFNITDPTAKSIGFTAAPPPQLGTGGNAGTVKVGLYNSSGVIDTTATNTVTLAVTGTASASYGPTAAVAGIATFSLSGTALVAGSYTYTASSGYTTDTVAAVETVGGANAWLLDANQTLVKLSSTGTLTTTVTGAGSTAATYGAIAFDQAGDVYSVNSAANSLQYTTNSGGTQANYSGGGLSAPVSLAVDGAGYIWIANSGNNTVSEFTDARSAVSPSNGFGAAYVTGEALSAPSAVAIDQTGGVWVTNKSGNTVTHIFGAAAPTVTPLSTATANGTLGTKP
jgi:sugar lactone lactonase YvrE